MNPVYIYKVEQIHAVDGIADGDSQQPRSALARNSIDRPHIVGSIDPVNPVYIQKVEQIQAVDGIADGDSNQPRSALGSVEIQDSQIV